MADDTTAEQSISDDRCAMKKDLNKDVRIIASVEQVPGGGGCCGYYQVPDV